MNLDKNRDKKLKPLVVRKDIDSTKENRPIIGITFLDKNNYGLENLYKVYRGDKNCIYQLNDFLDKARRYTTITELIKNHAPHTKYKNDDNKSTNKLLQIQNDYGIEATDFCHLHCCRDGKGIFVLHGFIISNCFEIVWLDAQHDVHK
jgi:hypothetical protein